MNRADDATHLPDRSNSLPPGYHNSGVRGRMGRSPGDVALEQEKVDAMRGEQLAKARAANGRASGKTDAFDGRYWSGQENALAGAIGTLNQAAAHPDTTIAKLRAAHLSGDRMLVDQSDFGAALRALRLGALLARRGWNGKGMWLGIQNPDANSADTLPYIWMHTADGHRVPWLASQTDMLASDWEIVG